MQSSSLVESAINDRDQWPLFDRTEPERAALNLVVDCDAYHMRLLNRQEHQQYLTKRVIRIHHQTILMYPANAFHSRLRGD